MQNRITTILGILFVFALLIPMGCKEKPKQEPITEQEEIMSEEVAEEQEMDMEAQMAQYSDQAQGKLTLIKLKLNAEELFKSNESSNIEVGSPLLQWIEMESKSQGNISSSNDYPSVKEFESDVFQGKTVIWMVNPSSITQGFKAKILQIEFNPGNQVIKMINPGESGLVIAQVMENAPLEQKEPYSIWFELENQNGDTRAFRLDPFILVNN